MLFYTNCARGLANNEIRLNLKEQKFLRLGGGGPPLNIPMVQYVVFILHLKRWWLRLWTCSENDTQMNMNISNNRALSLLLDMLNSVELCTGLYID